MAIGLVSLGPARRRPGDTRGGRRWRWRAGALFGVFFVLLAQTRDDSGMWPLVGGTGVSVALGLLAGAAARGCLRVPRRCSAGSSRPAPSTSAANALYLLATRDGLLSVVAPIAALYPVSTVLLALAVDRERVRPVQIAGLGLAATALVLDRRLMPPRLVACVSPCVRSTPGTTVPPTSPRRATAGAAAAAGADLAVLPEYVDYLGPAAGQPKPETIDGEFASFFADAARRAGHVGARRVLPRGRTGCVAHLQHVARLRSRRGAGRDVPEDPPVRHRHPGAGLPNGSPDRRARRPRVAVEIEGYGSA